MKNEHENIFFTMDHGDTVTKAIDICYHERTIEVKAFDGKTDFFLCLNCGEQL